MNNLLTELLGLLGGALARRGNAADRGPVPHRHQVLNV